MTPKLKQWSDDLVFEAGKTAMLTRQLEGDAKYDRWEGLSKRDLRVKFKRQALSLVFKAAFICYRSGVSEKKLHQTVETAVANAVKDKLNGG